MFACGSFVLVFVLLPFRSQLKCFSNKKVLILILQGISYQDNFTDCSWITSKYASVNDSELDPGFHGFIIVQAPEWRVFL